MIVLQQRPITAEFRLVSAEKHHRNSRLRIVCSQADTYELRICTNKTCKGQGSQQVSRSPQQHVDLSAPLNNLNKQQHLQIAQFGKDLSLPEVQVTTCGCLGNCGLGPNAVLIPTNKTNTATPTLYNHLSTPATLVKVIETATGVHIDTTILKSTELRLAGNAAARDGDMKQAIQLFTQGIDLNPTRGKHLLLSNRSGTRLALGDADGALRDAEEAVQCGPSDFTTAYIRQADALFALGRIAESAAALEAGAERHPPFAKTSDYKSLLGHVQKALKSSSPSSSR